MRGRRYITHDQLLAAVFNGYPNQRRRITSILEAYAWQRIRTELAHGLPGLCSPRRAELMHMCLGRRLRAIRRAIDGHAL